MLTWPAISISIDSYEFIINTIDEHRLARYINSFYIQTF